MPAVPPNLPISRPLYGIPTYPCPITEAAVLDYFLAILPKPLGAHVSGPLPAASHQPRLSLGRFRNNFPFNGLFQDRLPKTFVNGL